MHDEFDTNFHKRKQAGEIMMHNLYSERHEAERVGGNGPLYGPTSTISCSGINQTPQFEETGAWIDRVYAAVAGGTLAGTGSYLPTMRSLASESDISALVVEASTKALNDRGRSDANLWETLAESNKALGTLTGIFKSGTKVLDSQLKGHTFKAAKDGSSGYLAWRYGIKPIISDVHAVTEGLRRKVGRVRKVTRASKVFDHYDQKTLTYTGNSAFDLDLHQQVFDRGSVKAVSVDEYVATMLNNIGFTSKGLLTLPWELVTASFVADWIANIGDLIGALAPTTDWTNLGSCVVVKRETWLTYTASSTRPKTGWQVYRPATGGFTRRLYSTRRIAGPLTPGFTIRSDFKFWNGQRALDALTLLAQRVSVPSRAFRAVKGA
jgi:hypothetical protein